MAADFLYPDFNQTVNAGRRLGEEVGNDARNARAYRDGGINGVADQAFRNGDMQTGMAARQFQDQTTQRAYERMNQIGPWAQNVVRAASNLANTDPTKAQAFLTQNRQRFTDFGFSDDQINAGIAGLTNPDPTVRQQWAQTLNQAFSQHKDPNWRIVGQNVIGIDPDNGAVTQGGQLPPGSAGRMATPEEIQGMGFQGDTAVWIGADGTPHVLQNPHYERQTQAQQYSTLPPGFVLDDGQN